MIFTYVFALVIIYITVKNGTWASMRLMFPSQKTWKKPSFSSITLIYQYKKIFMTSFTHYDINGVITFYILIFNMISTIFNLIFKTLYGSLILGAGMHNTTHSPFTLFYFEIFNCSIYQGEHSDLLLSVHTCTCERNHFNKDFFFFFKKQ